MEILYVCFALKSLEGGDYQMINYVEYLNIPTKVALVIIAIFFGIQIVGEILEFKGKVVPEIFKIRKYFVRKKKERQALSQMTSMLEEHNQMADTLSDVKVLLGDINAHYNKDNISLRDKWMEKVDQHMIDSDKKREKQANLIQSLNDKLDENSKITLSILIDMKRDTIINFASYCADEHNPVTKEQFHRILKMYDEYEAIIEEHGMTNGEVDIAYQIITESYETRMRNHTFVEDLHGYVK